MKKKIQRYEKDPQEQEEGQARRIPVERGNKTEESEPTSRKVIQLEITDSYDSVFGVSEEDDKEDLYNEDEEYTSSNHEENYSSNFSFSEGGVDKSSWLGEESNVNSKSSKN